VLPIPIIALVLLPRRRDIIGAFADMRLTDLAAIMGTADIMVLNDVPLLQTFGVAIRGLAVR
jgi:manganese transport protein